MLMRKINAGISLFITLLLMDHSTFMGAWMMSKGTIPQNANALPRIMFVLMMVHAIISIALTVRGRKGAEKCKCGCYVKMNVPTYVQRASGILLIVLTVIHILGAVGVMHMPRLIFVIVTPLFFALSLVHVSVSVSKALITLGIGNAIVIKAVDVIMKVICAAIIVFDVVGFYFLLA